MTRLNRRLLTALLGVGLLSGATADETQAQGPAAFARRPAYAAPMWGWPGPPFGGPGIMFVDPADRAFFEGIDALMQGRCELPPEVQVHLFRGWHLLMIGRPDLARPDLEQAIGLAPGDALVERMLIMAGGTPPQPAEPVVAPEAAEPAIPTGAAPAAPVPAAPPGEAAPVPDAQQPPFPAVPNGHNPSDNDLFAPPRQFPMPAAPPRTSLEASARL